MKDILRAMKGLDDFLKNKDDTTTRILKTHGISREEATEILVDGVIMMINAKIGGYPSPFLEDGLPMLPRQFFKQKEKNE